MSTIDASQMSLDTYTFPHSRLRRRLTSPDRTPLVLIACGSFSPITFLHLRMFEMAADYARFNTQFEVVGAYLSCVGDAYKKTGLVKAEHRVNMCSLAVQGSSWIGVDPWEALHEEYLETAKVLDHFNREINENLGGVYVGDSGERKPARIALLAGADLIQTMSTPGVWAERDIDYILRNFGAFIVEVCLSLFPFSKSVSFSSHIRLQSRLPFYTYAKPQITLPHHHAPNIIAPISKLTRILAPPSNSGPTQQTDHLT